MAEDLFDRIAILRPHATKQERAIIDFLGEGNNPGYLTITEFADRAKVAESTLLRFCRKLGLRGYSEFRMLLSQSMNSEYSEDPENFARSILTGMTEALKSTYELLSRDDVEKAADVILSAKRVYAFGSGNSGVAATELRNKLLRLGVHLHCVEDSHLQAIAVSTLGDGDAVVLFSVSGSTKDMIDLARRAKELGVKCIIVTNHLRSPLLSYADVPLYVVAKTAPLDGGSLISKVSQLYVIDVLSAAVYQRIGDANARLAQTAASVFDKEI